jgi:hypothetical protein
MGPGLARPHRNCKRRAEDAGNSEFRVQNSELEILVEREIAENYILEALVPPRRKGRESGGGFFNSEF